MCGRYGFSKRAINLITEKMGLRIDGAIAGLLEGYQRQNHAPTMLGPVVRSRNLEFVRWGFVGMPRQEGAAPFHLNARSETVTRIPAFADSWAHRRCLVVADWFYEWDQQTKPKQPWRFVQEVEEPMVMAGFWKPTTLANGQTVDAYAVLTTDANPTVARVHGRMPVLLHQQDWHTWLDETTPPQILKSLHKPFDGPMYARPVNMRLNKSSYQGEVLDVLLQPPPPHQEQLHDQFDWKAAQFRVPLFWHWQIVWSNRRNCMQNLRWLIFFVLLSGCANAGEVVRLVTWNLQWFPGKKPAASQEERDKHFLEIAAVLPQFRADIIVLQEIRNDEAAQRLAKLIPGFSVHVTSRFPDSFTHTLGEQQIAILSRFKADSAWSESWKRGWAHAPRGYAYAKLLISGKPLHVYGLHLKSNLGNPTENTSKREDAMEQLLSHIKTLVKEIEPAIVAGDFNTSKEQVNLAGDTTLKKIETAAFFWTFEGIPLEHRITVPRKGSYPDACFDHIFVKNSGQPAAIVLKDTPGSDHLPVVVDLLTGNN